MSHTARLTDAMQRTLDVLIVEDEPRFRAVLLDALESMNCAPLAVASASEAVRSWQSRSPDLLVLDLNLPVVDGLTLLDQFRAEFATTPVIIITGFGDLPAAQRAINHNVTAFLTKPVHLGEIEHALDRARRRLAQRDAPDPASSTGTKSSPSTASDRSLAEIERDAILEALRQTRGNRSAAALQLGVSRRALYNKLTQYKHEGHAIP